MVHLAVGPGFQPLNNTRNLPHRTIDVFIRCFNALGALHD